MASGFCCSTTRTILFCRGSVKKSIAQLDLLFDSIFQFILSGFSRTVSNAAGCALADNRVFAVVVYFFAHINLVVRFKVCVCDPIPNFIHIDLCGAVSYGCTIIRTICLNSISFKIYCGAYLTNGRFMFLYKKKEECMYNRKKRSVNHGCFIVYYLI
jgi:hypothetical protein